MIKAIVSDLCGVLLGAIDPQHVGKLNMLYKSLPPHERDNFFSHFRLNRELLDFYGTLYGQYPLYLFTSETIQEDPAVKADIESVFRKTYIALDMGVSKKEPEAYVALARELGLLPSEILFIDDGQTNTASAREAGLEVIRYESNGQLMAAIAAFLKS